MTSISPAQSRPPLNIHPGLHRTHSRSASQILRSQAKEENKIEIEDDVEFVHERPAKRRKTSSASFTAPTDVLQPLPNPAQVRYQGVPWSTVVRVNAESQGERGGETVLPPLPDRPWGTTRAKEGFIQDIRPSVRVRKNVAVPNTPDSIEMPADAPLFEQRRYADYFPWTGRHAEDVVNEVYVKQGYYDRPPNPPDKELNTAKPPLYHAFKHKSGLDSLSAVFSMVLDAKNKHGAFSSASNFKGPPPRVTLTEIKRKSWISDLANPEVPLRRLSKTIPQGIRGTSLLEQCLQNTIPLSRAIWFTKCVGANEIRTLKRKGVNPTVSYGAEIKWLREWTSNVEQFIESILAQCGQNKWKEKTRYSIIFAARLYLENLLDRDHYLDWILKSLSAANSNHWPFWLMMIHLHRLDLIAFRKRGKQLAENLILKYNLARAAPGETMHPLASNFAAAIRPLIATRPNCFLMPEKWTECEKALSSCLEMENESDRQSFEYLKFVNERASGLSRPGGTAAASPAERVVEILDSVRGHVSYPSLLESLCQVCPDQGSLAVKCLEWCVSKYRSGSTRVYLTARLFRNLRKQGVSVDKVLLDFIFDKSQAARIDLAALKHVVSELSRSHSFPMSKYMQWLSVRGLPQSDSFTDRVLSVHGHEGEQMLSFQTSQDPQQLLTEVSLLRTEDHLINLRNSLLNQAGFDEELELTLSDQLRLITSGLLENASDSSSSRLWGGIRFDELSWAIKTRLSYNLRTEVVKLVQTSQAEATGKLPLPSTKGMTLARFYLVREVLERCGDIAILADVLRVISVTKQEDILAAAVDTINMHFSTLSVIGALEPLQLLYGQVYVALRPVKTAMPLYATALIDLCQQHSIKITPVRALEQDFVRGDRGRAVTAFSPFSDGVAESLQQAGATFYDDFEAILQTESNMNDQTMVRLSRVLIDRIEKVQHVENSGHDLFSLCQLLARLRVSHKPQSERLIKKWLSRLCSGPAQLLSTRLLLCLICTRCVTLEDILEACQELPPTSATRARLYANIRRAILDKIERDIDDSLAYGFKLAVSKFAVVKPVEMLEIIGTDETGKSSAAPIKSTLIASVLSNPDLIKALSKPGWLIVSQTLSEYLVYINFTDPPEVQAKALGMSVDSLSLPYCSLRMRMICQNAATKSDERIQDDIATVLCSASADPKSSLPTSPRTFQALLRATGPTVGAKVRSNIEQTFFNALPKFLLSKGLTQPPTPTPEEAAQASNALQQVILVNTDGNNTSQSSSIGGLIEKLTIYMKSLCPSSSLVQSQQISSPISATVPVMWSESHLHEFIVSTLDHLNLLLRMVCIKRTAFGPASAQPATVAGKPTQQDQVKLIGLLISIGTHPVWPSVAISIVGRAQQNKIRDMIDFAFDVAATLADDMSDDSRNFCARILKDKIKDERVRWLLGSINSFGSVQSQDVGAGYQVVQESKGVTSEWKPKNWEMLESGASNDSCLGLGMFGARRA